jgi:hypothetical protein
MVRKPKTGGGINQGQLTSGKTATGLKLHGTAKQHSMASDGGVPPQTAQHVVNNGDISYMYFTPRDMINFQTGNNGQGSQSQ